MGDNEPTVKQGGNEAASNTDAPQGSWGCGGVGGLGQVRSYSWRGLHWCIRECLHFLVFFPPSVSNSGGECQPPLAKMHYSRLSLIHLTCSHTTDQSGYHKQH